MKNKLKYLINFNLKKKFKSNYFKIVNILLLLLIPALVNIDKIIESFGGDFGKPTSIYVVDNVNAYDALKSTYEQSNMLLDSSNIKFVKVKEDVSKLKNEIKKEEKKDIIIELIQNEENVFDAKITSFKYVDQILYQNLINSINTTKTNMALLKSGIDLAKLENVYKSVNVERILLNEELDENEELTETLANVIIPIFIVPFFFLIMLVIQFIGAEINEEKTSKSMEIIISSVSPRTHFMSKIIATNIFVVVQGALLIVFGAIGIFLRVKTTGINFADSFGGNTSEIINSFLNSDIFADLFKALPLVILVLLLSFLAFSLLAGILASMTTSLEDYQQLQTPMMLVLLGGYYLSLFTSFYDNAIFIKIASYIPFVSAILSPALFMVGQTTIIDILITIVMLILACFLMMKYGLKIYKTGILNYSSSKLWKKMFNAVKEKN